MNEVKAYLFLETNTFVNFFNININSQDSLFKVLIINKLHKQLKIFVF